MPATLTRPKPKTTQPVVSIRLVEDIARGFKRVDSDQGIIYGAKIVGFESRNIGRTIGLDSKTFGDALDKTYGYSKAGLQEAIPMYEGATVRIDHPLSELDESGKRVIKQRSRPALSTNGVLRNVRMGEDGLYGDIHLFRNHPHTPFILEVAERAPDKIACSHNADGTPVLKNGRAIIEKINHVYSVDLVGDKPGTTNGLFEEFFAREDHMPKRTIQQIIDGLPDGAIARTELLEMATEMYGGKRVAEMDASPIMPSMAGGGASAQQTQSPAQQASDALRTVVMAIYDDPALDAGSKLQKIKEIFKLKAKLDGTGVDPTAGLGGGGDDTTDGDGDLGDTTEGGDDTGDTGNSDAGSGSGDDTGGDNGNPFAGKGKKKKTKSATESDAGGGDDSDSSNMEESVMAQIAKDNPAMKPLLEQLQAQGKDLATLKAENASLKLDTHCRGLLESANRAIEPVRLTALKALPNDETRKALIETWDEVAEREEVTFNRPSSSPPLLETAAAGEQAESGKDLASRLHCQF